MLPQENKMLATRSTNLVHFEVNAYNGTPTESTPLMLICLLGDFLLLQRGKPLAVREGSKTQQLLRYLGVYYSQGVSRAKLLESLWPDTDTEFAGQSLNSLIYSLRKFISCESPAASPVLHIDGHYTLNVAAGTDVDIAAFERWIDLGDQQARKGHRGEAIKSYCRAIKLYRGDLWTDTDLVFVLERERLRARYLLLLAKVADFYYEVADFSTCLSHAQQLLHHDPCREDAHRIVMRCYVRLGARSQALHQYRLCETILQHEFNAPPEASTLKLFDQIRLNPESI
ncbi:MAG: hypothetical protein EXR62_03760 [Chloroflexi bacterium]|nr:hypothetical protein [Chloroflexota bacterium]